MTESLQAASPDLRRKWREFVFRTGLSLGAVVIAILLAEFYVRVTGRAPIVYGISFNDRYPYQPSANPILGYEFKPGFRDPKADVFRSYPSINADGCRDVERRRTKAPGRKRILMLGDSVVAGLGLPKLEQTIPAQLEQMLRPTGVEVFNFGINGYCTLAEVERLRVRGLVYEPDMVMLVFSGNDYENFNNDLMRARRERSSLIKGLFIHSGLFRVLCLRFDWFNYRQETQSALHGDALLTQLDEQGMKSLARDDSTVRRHLRALGTNNVAEGFRRLNELSRRHGFKVVVLVWPNFGETEVNDVETGPGLEPLPRTEDQKLVVEQLAEVAGLSCFRLSPYFRADFERRRQARGVTAMTPRRCYTLGPQDNGHASPEGAKMAARAIFELMAKHPELRP